MSKKHEEKLLNSLKKLLHACVDEMGLPKKPTIIALYKANSVIQKYERELKKRETTIITLPIKEITTNK